MLGSEAHTNFSNVLVWGMQEGEQNTFTPKKCSDYYPFGLTMPGRSSNTGNPNDDYKFTGHERDDEAGLTLDYMMARNYDPVIGRFMQIDPKSNEFPDWSPYNYTMNNPINMWDPDGKAPTSCCYGQMAARRELLAMERGPEAMATHRMVVQNEFEGTIIATGLIFSTTATSVGLLAEGVFSTVFDEDANLAGASTRATVADQITEAIPGGKIKNVLVGAGAEVIAGIADRTVSGEQTDVIDAISDAVGGGVGALAGKKAGRRASALTTKKLIQKSIAGTSSSGIGTLINSTVNWLKNSINKNEEIENINEIKERQ